MGINGYLCIMRNLCHTGSVYHHKLAYVTNCMHACGLFAKKHSLSFSRITPRKINEIDKKISDNKADGMLILHIKNKLLIV